MELRILGCGSSGGVPRLGGHWGSLDPNNPLNRRRRCALLITRDGDEGATRVLIDTGPDLVPQLLEAGVGELDAVVWTHPHADHIHGIDDLRQIVQNTGRMIAGYADAPTTAALQDRFGYIFETPPGSGYPPIVSLSLIDGPLTIRGAGGPVHLTPFTVDHGDIPALGFRIEGDGPAAVYLPDVKTIPAAAWPVIAGTDLFIIDALRRNPHPSHAHLAQALAWIAQSGARRGVLTNMHLDMDYATVMAETPDHVVPAHDNLVLAL